MELKLKVVNAVLILNRIYIYIKLRKSKTIINSVNTVSIRSIYILWHGGIQMNDFVLRLKN